MSPLLYLRLRYWELLGRTGVADVRIADVVISKEKLIKSVEKETLEYSEMYPNYWKKMGET